MLKDLVKVPIGDVEEGAEIVYRDEALQKLKDYLTEAKCVISKPGFYQSQHLSPDTLVLTNKSNVRSVKMVKQYTGIKFKDLKVGKTFRQYVDQELLVKQENNTYTTCTSGVSIKNTIHPDQVIYPTELNQ